MRKLLGAVVLAAVCLTVASCSGGPTVTALDAEQTEQDVLPAHIMEAAVDPDSTRFAAERESYAFYLARPLNAVHDTEACVVIVHNQDETGWMAACSNVSPAVLMVGQIGGLSASVIPDNYDASERIADGWERVHENLLVKQVQSS